MDRIIKIIALLIALCTLLSCIGCAEEGENTTQGKTVTAWVYSEQVAQLMGSTFKSDNPGLEWNLDIKAVDAGDFEEEFAKAEAEGKIPDIVLLSPENLAKYLESGKLCDLVALGLEPDPDRYYSYAYDMGFDSTNSQRAMCWQADPILFFYRRSIAKYYLGTDDPAEISQMVSSFDSFIETAIKLKEASGGATRILAGTEDLLYVYMNSENWIDENGRFAITDEAEKFIDTAYTMENESLTWGAQQYSQAWLSGISDGQSVFGYFMSGIGLDNVLKKACGGDIAGEGSFGDWAAAVGFSSCNMGGSWMAIPEDAKNKEEALYFVSYFTCETEAMKKYFLASGDFCANTIVSEQIQFDPQFTESFLGGQNYYSLLADSAEHIPSKKAGKFESRITSAFAENVTAYTQGYKTREQAIEDLKKTAEQIINAS